MKVALNVQPGQRVLINGPLANGGVSLDAAPLVRRTAESAYRAGAEYVEALWGVEALQLARFRHAPRNSFDSFYNTLFDENAASHVAIGSAYRFTMESGDAMSAAEFERAGGNRSATHVDFMIGCAELDIDGVARDGTVEPLMRRGEWVNGIPKLRI